MNIYYYIIRGVGAGVTRDGTRFVKHLEKAEFLVIINTSR
jgi:hypothetical protein